MEIKTVLVSLVLAALGIAVALAGFAAEALKPKKSQLKVVYHGLDHECDYPSSPVMRIAIAAVVALVIARTIITATTGGCCSCCRPIPSASKFARLCIRISWFMSIVAVILFIVGAILSGEKGVEIDVNDVFYCYTLRPGVFGAAGIIGLVSVLLGLVYYFVYLLARSRAAEKSGVDLELEKPHVTDVKKPTKL
ncbi:putative modifying wall lignin-1/2 [Helianthus anomalus]